MFNSKGTERTFETNISEKTCTPVDKKFCPFSLVFPEYDRTQGTINQAPEGILIIFVEVVRAFLLHSIGCWKPKFLETRLFFQWNELLAHFSPITESDEPHEKIYQAP